MSPARRKRPQKARHTVKLAIADIALAEELLGQNQAVLKRFAAELSTVRARLTGAARLLVNKDEV